MRRDSRDAEPKKVCPASSPDKSPSRKSDWVKNAAIKTSTNDASSCSSSFTYSGPPNTLSPTSTHTRTPPTELGSPGVATVSLALNTMQRIDEDSPSGAPDGESVFSVSYTRTTRFVSKIPAKLSEIDSMGRALKHLTVTSENYREIRKQLPKYLRVFISFRGPMWMFSHPNPPEPVPLFIANRPVSLPMYAYGPVTTVVVEPQRPADPLDRRLDPLLPLPDTIVQIALQTFPGAVAFMTFFDGTFFVAYDDFDMAEMLPLIPERFGGLRVGATNNSFSYSCAGHEKSTGVVGQVSQEITSGPEQAFGEVGEVSQEITSGPEQAPGEVSEVSQAITPGSPIWVKGPHQGHPNLGEIPRGAGAYIPALVLGSSARAGLLIQSPSGASFLTTVAHLFVTHNEHINRGEKAFRLIQTKPKIVGTKAHLTHDGDTVSEPVYRTFWAEQLADIDRSALWLIIATLVQHTITRKGIFMTSCW